MRTDAAKCVCHEWVTDGLHLNFIKDAADGHVLEVEAMGPFPMRTAISPRFVKRQTDALPGMAEWRGARLIIRTTRLEHAYRRVAVCPGCGYILLESEGAA